MVLLSVIWWIWVAHSRLNTRSGIKINVDSESCKLGPKFQSWMKLGMKSTSIMAEIKIVCKMGSFIHVFKGISGKITGKIRLSVHESETSGMRFSCIRRDLSILNSVSHVNTKWVWSVVQDWNSIRIHVNYPYIALYNHLVQVGNVCDKYAHVVCLKKVIQT